MTTTTKPMTQRQLIDAVHALNLSCKVTDGEIRINFRDGTEESAHYTTDRQDALDTARDMNYRRCVRRDRRQRPIKSTELSYLKIIEADLIAELRDVRTLIASL